ncbi:MAG: Na(+)/H(+) antiporter subunit C1 [Paracidovorax wautersii]|uniref:Na(+)/H(+) antiporter subunit C1 n=1 Tax=Paracidovorax wautersii TaxID=1177982 RepID=A0A7V8FML8_9BURK|nr:MAG: Na(+)/H(+) antiporter subunit C1 [Paracidovorax wautersii]
MEIVIALAIGVMTGSGVWLLLRPRTFQVVMGLSLLSYAVNLFIFSTGRLNIDREPVIKNGTLTTLFTHYTDPLPQALVLTAIVIGFAMTALFLVLLVSRGLTGTDHVDGGEGRGKE